MDLAGAVRGDDDDRRMLGLDGAEFRHRHLEVGQHLQQEGLEGLVGAVEFVDQQDRRAAPGRAPAPAAAGASPDSARRRCPPPAARGRPRPRPPPAGSPSSDRHSSTRRRRRRRRAPRSIAAGSACGRASRRAPWRSPSCRRPPLLPAGWADPSCRARNTHGRERAVGDVIAGREQLQRLVDGSGKCSGHGRGARNSGKCGADRETGSGGSDIGSKAPGTEPGRCSMHDAVPGIWPGSKTSTRRG